jgi:primosomal protein N' (replication factor Y)
LLRVAVPVPLRRLFDYLPPDGMPDSDHIVPGMRVRVPFAGRSLVGMVVERVNSSDVPLAKIKRATQVLDREVLLPADTLALLQWAAGYYRHPLGEVIATALPKLLRDGAPAEARGVTRWQLTSEGGRADLDALTRAPRQREAMDLLRETGRALSATELPGRQPGTLLKALAKRGWVESLQTSCLPPPTAVVSRAPGLNSAQQAAVTAIDAESGFVAWLLDGVTGSGKTEVYLGVLQQVMAAGRQALVLVPEIGLAPQTVGRFRSRFGVPVAMLHSGLNSSERLCAWLAAASGEARIVLGTRSAVFIPMPELGMVIVDEEHDQSYKQQDGFRYSARDLAVVRAQRADVPVVLGSATPGLETLHNARNGRYRTLSLPERAGVAVPPRVRLLDLRGKALQSGMSEPLLKSVAERLERGEQSLLFINRRGYAPTLLCHACGWIAECLHCDARLTLYRQAGQLCCRHCGALRPLPRTCEQCGVADLRPLGIGTERVEETLRERFPEAVIARVDRDSMSRRGALERLVEQARSGEIQILLGTQMLAKGHDFPGVTLVGVLDADQGLFGADFRSTERMAQLMIQVAGRAGRAELPGEFVIQTHQPHHPLLRKLLADGYGAFAGTVLDERRLASLPPYAGLALLRAEAPDGEQPAAFLRAVRDLARGLAMPGVDLFGPIPAPMERRAGRFRAQLLLQAHQRRDLQALLKRWLPLVEKVRAGKELRWSLDVDPVDTV